jgi:hypothetical protein
MATSVSLLGFKGGLASWECFRNRYSTFVGPRRSTWYTKSDPSVPTARPTGPGAPPTSAGHAPPQRSPTSPPRSPSRRDPHAYRETATRQTRRASPPDASQPTRSRHPPSPPHRDPRRPCAPPKAQDPRGDWDVPMFDSPLWLGTEAVAYRVLNAEESERWETGADWRRYRGSPPSYGQCSGGPQHGPSHRRSTHRICACLCNTLHGTEQRRRGCCLA